MTKKLLFLMVLIMTLSTQCFGEIEIYSKKVVSKDDFLYLDTNMNFVFGKVYRNDEVKVIKEIEKAGSKLYLVEVENKKTGVIKDILTDIKVFDKKIKITTRSKESQLLYSMKTKEIFRNIEIGDEFWIEENPRGEENGWKYYLTSLGFFLKMNMFDQYDIVDQTKCIIKNTTETENGLDNNR